MEVRQATLEEVQKAQAAGTLPPLVPVGLDLCSCATAEEMHSNFYATLERGYTPVNGLLGSQSGKASIVGSAPSLEETWIELDGDICAINSSLAFLLEKNVVPKWAMLWDAHPLVAKFAVPHPDVTYLVASRCHPSVFERLKDCKVIVWQAGGDHDIVEVLNRPEVIAKQPCHEPLINGGSAGVTRAIFVMQALGYTALDIHGADSSYTDGKTHVRGSVVQEKDFIVALGNQPPIYFRTTPEWMAQVDEYKAIYMLTVTHGIPIRVFGNGLLPTMHALLEARRKHLGHEQFMEETSKQLADQHKLNQAASKMEAERIAA